MCVLNDVYISGRPWPSAKSFELQIEVKFQSIVADVLKPVTDIMSVTVVSQGFFVPSILSL